MVAAFRNETFEIPTATPSDMVAATANDRVVTPSLLGSAATRNASEFATATQGAKADTALQPGAVPAEAALRLVEFDIRMAQFAGGAKLNGIDDDRPAIQAAVDHVKTLGGRYTGGMGVIRLPRGQVKLGGSIDLYANTSKADNVRIEGEGPGATNITIAGDFTGFRSAAPPTDTLYRTQFAKFTVTGPGRSNVNAHAFDIDALNDGRFENIEVFSCRRALSLAHQWQTEIRGFRASAPLANALSCYDGLYLKDGVAGIVENAIEMIGGKIQGCERYGIRGESVTGSYISGLEILNCGNVGVYLGESPTGKDLKWFSWVGGLIDTCPQLVAIKKGTSTVAELLHFSGMWLGYASASNGTGVEMIGLRDCTFSADMVVNVVYGANIKDCQKVTINLDTVARYDRTNTGAVAIICNNTVKSSFRVGNTTKNPGSPSTTAFSGQASEDYNHISGVFDGAVSTVGANTNKAGALIVP